MRRLAALGLGAALALVAQGGGDDGRADLRASVPAAAPAAPRPPALCRSLRVAVTGRVAAAAATELSGLVASRSQRGVLWAHNDSGDRPRLLALAPDGRLLADVAVPGAENVDWEDIAAARDVLLIGDIGDNLAQRASIAVFRVDEPRLGDAALRTTRRARRLELRYPDGPRDAEALLRDPSDGKLVIVEKSYAGRAGVYVADRVAAGATTTLRRSGRIDLGPGEAVTAGDVAADGRTIALRTYDRVVVWVRGRDESVAGALRRRPCVAREGLLSEGQGETLALRGDGRAFFTVPEGARPALRRYAPG